ncbi:hypothetical protein G6F54_014481 [Rhizopus delemar]|nr:hypothetical protein G6F54_014481 [Rhizopus delemar]
MQTPVTSFKRVWLITGASRGIGALIAEAALADGNAVIAAGRNVDAIAKRLGDPGQGGRRRRPGAIRPYRRAGEQCGLRLAGRR